MSADRAAQVQTLRAFCERHPQWALFDEPTAELLEIASGKRLRLPLGDLAGAEERANSQTGRPYLMLRFGDGHEIAVADVGVAFPPVAPTVPQAPELPPVVCLQDFRAVLDQLRHQALEHPEQRLERTTLDGVVLALGILEGARRIGFDISDEERHLEAVITALEKRR